jgi:hypothetical protein
MKRTDLKVGEQYGAGRIRDWQESPSSLEKVEIVDAGEWHALSGVSPWHTKVRCRLANGEVVETAYVKPATQYDRANVVWVYETKADGSKELTAVKTSRIKALWSDVVELSDRKRKEYADTLEQRKQISLRNRAKDDEALATLRALPDEVFAGLNVDVRKERFDYEDKASFTVTRAFIARLVAQAHKAGYEQGAAAGFTLGTVDQ